MNNVDNQNVNVMNTNNDNNIIMELENLRLKARNRAIIAIIIGILIIILSFFLAQPFIIIMAIAGALLIYRALCAKPTKEFVNKYKKTIILDAFNKKFSDVTYKPDLGIDSNVIAQTQMMYMGDVYSSNDYINAKYKNINFESADVLIQKEYTDDDGNTHYTTIFQGQWFIFDFNKPFKADLQVCEKNFTNAKRKGLFAKKEEQLHKVELEDIEFNKIFNVYSQVEVEAFYVLTPNVMQHIKELNNKIPGSLLFCFINNKLHVGLYNNKDLFEASIFRKVDAVKDEQRTLQEISYITDFIDILQLDNTLFKGGEM